MATLQLGIYLNSQYPEEQDAGQCLAGLVEQGNVQPGDRIGVYSYGSGSCAEFYSLTVADTARETVRAAGIPARLDDRLGASVDQYEACERSLHASLSARDFLPPLDLVPGLYESRYAGRGRLVFRGIANYHREYAWS